MTESDKTIPGAFHRSTVTMGSTLIIKLGALGDVLRTTPILRELEGQVTWVTAAAGVPLLRGNPYIHRIVTPQDVPSAMTYDRVLSLDDDDLSCRIATDVRKKVLIGAYLDRKGCKRYTDDSAGWFDMGLISRHGLERANQLKKDNFRTYQDYLFEMAGLTFSGQEYVLGLEPGPLREPCRVGIEARAGDRWPMKIWPKYQALAEAIRPRLPVRFFGQRDSLHQYMRDINLCDVIVTGDTLCMHIALALGKKVFALFGPTSADEIYGYGLLTKIVSPVGCVKCYIKTECPRTPSCMDLISVETLADALLGCAEQD